jgi:hypothetical protein
MLQDYDFMFREGKKDEKLEWFANGITGQVLKYGANGWQKGKVRISLEFCPDEPELQKASTPDQLVSSDPESPLDDIRRMQ